MIVLFVIIVYHLYVDDCIIFVINCYHLYVDDCIILVIIVITCM